MAGTNVEMEVKDPVEGETGSGLCRKCIQDVSNATRAFFCPCRITAEMELRSDTRPGFATTRNADTISGSTTARSASAKS